MAHISEFLSYKKSWVLAALALGSVCTAPAATISLGAPKTDCTIYQQQEQANLTAVSQADAGIRAARLDTVFYSTRHDACLASLYYSKGGTTYAGIVDIHGQRTLWARSYRGTAFSPVRIIAMDREMDEAIRDLEFAPAVTNTNARGYEFLPLLFDRTMSRTMNTLPAIKNALTASR